MPAATAKNAAGIRQWWDAETVSRAAPPLQCRIGTVIASRAKTSSIVGTFRTAYRFPGRAMGRHGLVPLVGRIRGGELCRNAPT